MHEGARRNWLGWLRGPSELAAVLVPFAGWLVALYALPFVWRQQALATVAVAIFVPIALHVGAAIVTAIKTRMQIRALIERASRDVDAKRGAVVRRGRVKVVTPVKTPGAATSCAAFIARAPRDSGFESVTGCGELQLETSTGSLRIEAQGIAPIDPFGPAVLGGEAILAEGDDVLISGELVDGARKTESSGYREAVAELVLRGPGVMAPAFRYSQIKTTAKQAELARLFLCAAVGILVPVIIYVAIAASGPPQPPKTRIVLADGEACRQYDCGASDCADLDGSGIRRCHRWCATDSMCETGQQCVYHRGTHLCTSAVPEGIECTDPDMCSDGAVCINDHMGIGSIGAHCRRRCREQGDCDDGYFCAPVSETELHACIPLRHSTDEPR
jgi:hypothetical protein